MKTFLIFYAVILSAILVGVAAEEMPSYPLSEPGHSKAVENIAIITTKATVAGSAKLQPFVDAKIEKGFGVIIATEDDWDQGGADKADDIRNWLIANYKTQSITYVILIGDPRPKGLGDVPMKLAKPGLSMDSTAYCGTDYYFAELTGNWDNNGNGIYGEPIEIDSVSGPYTNSNVFVGRIPVYNNNYGALDTILQRCIDYGNADKDQIAWRKNVLFPVEPWSETNLGYHYAEAFKRIADMEKWKTYRIYKSAYPDSAVFPDEFPTTVIAVKNAWNSNPYGACDWSTHGIDTLAEKIMSTDAAQELDDTYPSFVLQGSCWNANPFHTNNLAYNILRHQSIGTIANTHPGLLTSETDPTAKKLITLSFAYYFAVFCIQDENPIGEVLARLKGELNEDYQGHWRHYCTMVLYGDPTLSIRSCSAETIVSTTPKTIQRQVFVTHNRKSVTFRHGYDDPKSVRLTVFDMTGKTIHTQVNRGALVSWKKNVPAGVYVYVLDIRNGLGKVVSHRDKIAVH